MHTPLSSYGTPGKAMRSTMFLFRQVFRSIPHHVPVELRQPIGFLNTNEFILFCPCEEPACSQCAIPKGCPSSVERFRAANFGNWHRFQRHSGNRILQMISQIPRFLPNSFYNGENDSRRWEATRRPQYTEFGPMCSISLKKAQKSGRFYDNGGLKRDRTTDLFRVKEALSQLSYKPKQSGSILSSRKLLFKVGHVFLDKDA